MGFQTFDERVLANQQVTLGLGNTPGGVGITSGQTLGSRVDSLVVVNNDVIDHIVWVSIIGTNNENRLGSVNVPARTGFDGTNGMDLVTLLAPASLACFPLAVGANLNIGTDDTLIGTTIISGNAVRGDF